MREARRRGAVDPAGGGPAGVEPAAVGPFAAGPTRARAGRHGRVAALVGAAVWVAVVLVARPAPFATAWIRVLLLFAPLVLVPLALDLVLARWGAGAATARRLRVGQLATALLLAGSFLLRPGPAAAALALPWLALTAAIAALGLRRLLRRGPRPLAEAVIDLGAAYLAVGGAWTLADRLAYQPLGFATAIVALTAVHFHYAGFLLPLVTGLAVRRTGSATARLAGVGVVVAVPLVAAGITTTQLARGVVVEAAAALLMAASGMLAAWLHLRLAARGTAPAVARGLWAISGLSLAAGMVLAALYGARFFLSVPGLDVGWMQVSHGPLNAFGFGLAGVLGWRLADGGE